MKVLYVDQFGKTAGRDSIAQCRYIQNNEGIDITIYLSDNTEIPAETKNLKIVKGFRGAYEGNTINKAKNYLKALKELKQYIKKEKFDIVHLQWFSLPWLEWIYVRSLRKYSKVVITVHDVIPFNVRPFEMKCLDLIYDAADQLLLHTESSRKQFCEHYRTKTPIEIITQGFCLKSDYIKLDGKKAKAHFGIPENSVVFLFYGTIRHSKGFDYLIRAIGNASKKNEKIVLLAGGAFQKLNPETYQKLLKESLEKTNYFVDFNFIPMEEEQWYFSAADVICLPYLEITQSGVAQVGLMYELPMIASDIGEMNQVTRAGVNGELVHPKNILELEQAILKLASDPDLRKRYSEGSKILAEKEFSVEIKGQKVSNAYRRLMNEQVPEGKIVEGK